MELRDNYIKSEDVDFNSLTAKTTVAFTQIRFPIGNTHSRLIRRNDEKYS